MIKIKTTNTPDHPALAVGAVVFKDRHVLLVKRGNAPAKGMWAIPGGRVELGETLKQAAEREIPAPQTAIETGYASFSSIFR